MFLFTFSIETSDIYDCMIQVLVLGFVYWGQIVSHRLFVF